LAVLWIFACSFVFLQAVQPGAKEKGAGDQVLDTARILRAVVGVQAEVPGDARTANSLGTTRDGSGVVIDDRGLVLTIGYLILEAASAEIISGNGKRVPATIVGYDHNTGFGLVRATQPLDIKPLRLGDSAALEEGARVLVISHEGPIPVSAAQVVSRRPFAGYWEYLLDRAIYIAPPHPKFGGAALIGGTGRLLGIGSLVVGDAVPEPTPVPGNMFIPINLLKPILGDLIENGRSRLPSHPWLGAHTAESEGRVYISRVTRGGPADQAGLKIGDIIVGIGGKRVRSMVDFFRKAWSKGEPGTDIPLDVLRLGSSDMRIEKVVVRSDDRYNWLKLHKGY